MLVGLLALAIFFIDDWLGARRFIFESNIDNRDIILPMQLYFLETIQKGHIPYWVPYIWSGARFMGDPNFQVSPLHVIAALLLNSNQYLQFLSVWSVLVVCGSFWGVYRLISVLLPERSAWITMVAALLYVFSTGFFFARQFTSTEFVFLTIPWVWYWFYVNRPVSAVRNAACITVILWFQFTYGQLQFSIYTVWLTFLFCLFVPDKKYRRLNLLVFVASLGCAAILASYYLIPVVDNLVTHGGGVGDRLFGIQSLATKIVEPVYLLRLIFPSLFGWHYPDMGISADIAGALGVTRHEIIPWWPIWKDGWSAWESFSAYQGSFVTIVALFGIVFLKGSWFWRVGYVAIILAVTTETGALLLYAIHLGTDVPYGRATVLLGLFSTVLFVQAFFKIIETRRTQMIFTIYLCVAAIATFVLSRVGLPEKVVQYLFERSRIPMGEFYALHQASFQTAVLNHGIFIFAAAVITICYIVATSIFHSKKKIHFVKIVLIAGFMSITLADAILFYSGARESERMSNGAFTASRAVLDHDAVEAMLVKDGADFSQYRLHLDMPFEAHRKAAYAETKNAEIFSRGLSQQWIPNRPILAGIAITSGYSSIIPDGIRYTELLNWRGGARDFRAHGDYSVLHPALFDVFSIQYVLRMKSEPTRNTPWRSAVLDPWERVFRENAKLLYEDEAYQLFKYGRAPSMFYFPRRIVYTDSLINDVLGISHVVDHFVDHWEPTGFLPRNLFSREINKQYPNTIIEKQRSIGEIMATPLEKGWKIVVRAKDASFLLAGLRYDPWWKVSVDGKSVAPIQANGIFTGVPIAAGEHIVIFRLKPMSVYIGVTVTLAGFFFMLVFFIVNQLRNYKRSAQFVVH